MFYALETSTRSWLHASNATRDGQYTCDCPDGHRVCLKLPSGRENVEYRGPHFSHLPKSDTECRKGGESLEHKAAKHKLREMRGQYSFVTEKCPECKCEKWETCANGTVDIEVRSADGRWWYDCLYRSELYSVALEVLHTHATTLEKIVSTRESGVHMAEFSASEINAMQPGAQLLNLQIVTRFCSPGCECVARERLVRQEKYRLAQLELERERAQLWREEENARLERMREQAEIVSREQQRKLIAMRELLDSEAKLRQTGAREMEIRRRIAGEWRTLKLETEVEREDIINEFESGGREEKKLCRGRWVQLKSRRTAARAVLLKEWRCL